MKTINKEIWSMHSNGELLYERVNQQTKKKYEPDSVFFYTVVTCILMFLCGMTDFCVFNSLFKTIAYDNETIRIFSIIGLLIGFDVIPVYIGVHAKRLRQGLSRDWFILFMALSITFIAVCLNIGLRISTIDEMSPASSSGQESAFVTEQFHDSSETGTDGTSGENQQKTDSTAMALTVFGCLLPVVTSVGSFCVSYLTYDPLMIRKQREEELINEKKEEIRRLRATVLDYEADKDFEKNLREYDDKMFHTMQKEQRAKAVSYCNYVKQRVREHLGDAASGNILTAGNNVQLLKQLCTELEEMEELLNQSSQIPLPETQITTITGGEAAA